MKLTSAGLLMIFASAAMTLFIDFDTVRAQTSTKEAIKIDLALQ